MRQVEGIVIPTGEPLESHMALTIKIWFCVAVALIAATVADAIVEFASNSGWFGAGNFTDRSNWNIIPALLVGMVFVGLHLYLRVRTALRWAPNWRDVSSALGRRFMSLVPWIFAAQIASLYLIETSEQLVVYHHSLGGIIWLGGPTFASLAAHAMSCCFITLVAARVIHTFAEAALQLVKLVQAFTMLPVRDVRPTFVCRQRFVTNGRSIRVHWHMDERAPPLLTV
jgi:hypothetical protein